MGTLISEIQKEKMRWAVLFYIYVVYGVCIFFQRGSCLRKSHVHSDAAH